MNVPKWPVELPQTYDIVSETTYERDMIGTPSELQPTTRLKHGACMAH
jgi:hypothetical protein